MVERDDARTTMLRNPSEANKRELALKQKRAKQIIRKNKRISTIMKDDQGTLITDKEEVTREFKKVLEQMLNISTKTEAEDNNIITVEQYLEEPTLEEVKMAVEMLKGGKAPGEDTIIAELLKNGGITLMINLKQLINKIWREETIPKAWQVSILCPIYKKGDVINCQNYRGISLLNTTYKVLSNIILNRLTPYAKDIVGEYQAGFTAGKSTTDQIHVIKQITEESHEFDKDVYLLFVNFKQAYDSIARSTLWNVMVQLGIPAKLVRMVKACMKNSRCKVKFKSVLSKEFTVTTRVRQGDALSPILFNIALESLVKEALQNEPQGLDIGQGKQVFLAAYADDIVVIAETEDSLKRTNDILIDAAKKIGLIINENKTNS
ncbi:hypothetical protein QTP88_020098 [Uroleucon formosanum]